MFFVGVHHFCGRTHFYSYLSLRFCDSWSGLGQGRGSCLALNWEQAATKFALMRVCLRHVTLHVRRWKRRPGHRKRRPDLGGHPAGWGCRLLHRETRGKYKKCHGDSVSHNLCHCLDNMPCFQLRSQSVEFLKRWKFSHQDANPFPGATVINNHPQVRRIVRWLIMIKNGS